jgi:nicotinamidase-related amidase
LESKLRQILEHPTAALDGLNSERTALLAIHWQVDVVKASGALHMFDGEAERSGLIARAVEIVAAARAADIPVMYSNIVFAPDYGDLFKNNPLFKAAPELGGARRGTPGAEVIAELAPKPDDLIFDHVRLTAFYGTALDVALRNRGIDTLITFGIATNVAVDSTVREGVQLGYNMILVEDCCCSSSPDFHEASIKTMRVLATEVTTTAATVAKLRALAL